MEMVDARPYSIKALQVRKCEEIKLVCIVDMLE